MGAVEDKITQRKKIKIAFVTPRYGPEVNGGAELYCRQLAEKLSNEYDIEVLTTCAIDYITWKDEYEEGVTQINNITVRRFKVDKPRNIHKFNRLTPKVLEKGHTLEDEIIWMNEQGPACSKLISYLKSHHVDYTKILFIPYLYYTTYFGSQIAPEKSILIPAAHDEPFINLDIFKDLFCKAGSIVYLTEEEKKFVVEKFQNGNITSDIIGTGIDIPTDLNCGKFKFKYSIDYNYIVYVGRIDESKGCDSLFEYFIKYKKNNPSNLKLVLVGKPSMKTPKNDDIVSLGFVSDEDKYCAIAESQLLVLPSRYESLSLVVLESMALGKPVLVNGDCEVLKGHCIKSNAGLYYRSYLEFCCLTNLMVADKKLLKSMGNNGRTYILNNYTWEIVQQKIIEVIEKN